MDKKNGFTLLEIMIVIAVVAVVFAFIGVGVLEFTRSSKQEQALLEMDRDANRVLETIKQTLLSGYIPVSTTPLVTGRTGLSGVTDLEANIANWREVLANGTDLLVFLVAIDAEEDGDLFYQGGSATTRRMIFGLESPERSAAVPNGLLEATDFAETWANLGIVDLNPAADLGLPINNGSDIDIGASRFDAPFVYPVGSGRNHIYGVIRFAPYRPDGQNTILIDESEIAQDLNLDEDTLDQFILGHIEVVYPRSDGGVITRQISTDSILLQVNRDDDPQSSIFQLWPVGTSGDNIKIQLVVCDVLQQGTNSWVFNIEGHHYLSRTYESMLKLPLMSVE